MKYKEDHYTRVILHLDLDCFYAQVEHNRLQIPLTVPLAVQQWNGLIAVNYAARDAGVKRHMTVEEALLKCPQLRLVHVPTYSISTTHHNESSDHPSDDLEIVALPKYSDEMPAFRADGSRLPPNPPDPASNKACLEPYRHASMAIFRLIRSWASQLGEGNLIEKGGLDEAFIDITEEVEQQLIDQFAQKYVMLRDELASLGDEHLEDEALDNLAMYDTSWIDTELDFTGLGETVDDNGTEDDSEDIINDTKTSHNTLDNTLVENVRMKLGKLRIWKGAQIAKSLRSLLRSQLSFIASIGIAPNKMLAKLVSALYKPDKQTRIEPQAIANFMRRVPFEKIRMMGGKMGKSVLESAKEKEDEDDVSDEESDNEQINTNNTSNTTATTAADLWPLSVNELADRVGDKPTAQWIHQLIRGHDPSPVTPRSLTKSFMSAKSFRPAVRDWPELHDWVIVLIGELWSRIGEEREASNRWPSTITVHYKSYSKKDQRSSATWSNVGSIAKSCEFPFASSIPSQATRSHFLTATFKLLSSQPALFPMSRLAVSVTNFKGLEADGKAKATRVDQYFKKQSADETYTIPASLFPADSEKKIPSEQPKKLTSEIKKSTSVLEMLQASAKTRGNDSDSTPTVLFTQTDPVSSAPCSSSKKSKKQHPPTPSSSANILKFFQPPLTDSPDHYQCKECKFKCAKTAEKEIQEHLDYHLALKLSRE